ISQKQLNEEKEKLEINESLIKKDLNEIKSFGTNYGALIRLLQLQKNLIRNIMYGENILNFMENKNISFDSKLYDILKDLKDKNVELSQKINEINLSLNNLEKENITNIELVSYFINIKSEIINLTKEFRENLKNISEEEKKALREELKNKTFENHEKLRKEIEKTIREFNKKKILDLLNKSNISIDEFLNKVRDKNLTYKEIRDMLKDQLKSFNNKTKIDFLKNLEKEKEKIEVAKQIALNTRLKFEKNENIEKVKDIMKNENLTIEEKRAKLEILIQERINERKKFINERKEEIESKKNEFREENKEKREDKKEEAKNIRNENREQIRNDLRNNEN
ncbi:MAG: hypothetical protein QW757_05810, partial [Candidatus Woesearchaeota archaeon]